eukprot:m51a1_g2917 putative glutamine amidotransferase (197) ;mRNA; r:527451-528041
MVQTKLIGVLALQGGFSEHVDALRRAGAEVREVRLPRDLEGLDGLVLPGGESTTMGKLAVHYGLMEPLRQFARTHAVWGSCAGAIMLSKDAKRDQPLIGAMDLVVTRNAFGSQIDSFEEGLSFDCLSSKEKPFPAVFIRAPVLEPGKECKVLCALPDGRVVACQQGKLLATSFHPELTQDLRFHEYFLSLVEQQDH